MAVHIVGDLDWSAGRAEAHPAQVELLRIELEGVDRGRDRQGDTDRAAVTRAVGIETQAHGLGNGNHFVAEPVVRGQGARGIGAPGAREDHEHGEGRSSTDGHGTSPVPSVLKEGRMVRERRSTSDLNRSHGVGRLGS